MVFQRFVITIADGQTLVIPDFPARLIKLFDDSQDPVPVLVGITDKDKGLFFIRQERGGQFFKPGRKQAVKGFKLIIEDEGKRFFCTIPVGGRAFCTDKRQVGTV